MHVWQVTYQLGEKHSKTLAVQTEGTEEGRTFAAAEEAATEAINPTWQGPVEIDMIRYIGEF